jgi:hypothetical protein
MPTHFPPDLKELVHRGWSKEPKERPPIEEFKSALKTLLTQGEHLQATDKNNSTKNVVLKEREVQPDTPKKFKRKKEKEKVSKASREGKISVCPFQATVSGKTSDC